MNRENLQRMADYIKTIPQEKFDMGKYRDTNDIKTHECNSVGCVIGHCTILDKNPLPIFKNTDGIRFTDWSEVFTGLNGASDEWGWCFASEWYDVDNTPTGAAKRIEWMLDNDLPEDWEEQKDGWNPLCYNS